MLTRSTTYIIRKHEHKEEDQDQSQSLPEFEQHECIYFYSFRQFGHVCRLRSRREITFISAKQNAFNSSMLYRYIVLSTFRIRQVVFSSISYEKRTEARCIDIQQIKNYIVIPVKCDSIRTLTLCLLRAQVSSSMDQTHEIAFRSQSS